MSIVAGGSAAVHANAMKISITHTRAIQGHDILVHVDAGDGETLTWVQTQLDGFVVGTDVLDPAQQSYERSFAQAGDAAPMMDHQLDVEAINDAERTSRATVRWTDAV